MRRILLTGVLCLMTLSGLAQVYPTQYRPAGLDWQRLITPHFTIIFPSGEDSLALRAGQIMEQQYPSVEKLVGGRVSGFPVVLNNFNDLSNGFVTPFNYRSEIELPPIRSKLLNPQSGDWLETVLPHELVHVSHFNVDGGIIGDVLGYFWPDARRTIHFFAPAGVHEGIATYHESTGVLPNGGRLNHPFFFNRFTSNFNSSDRWGAGQSLFISDFSRPFNRHYLGATPFTHWLEEEYGSQITRETIERHYQTFFLGYGFALKHTTGKWPAELYDEFESYTSSREKHRLQDLKSTDQLATVVDLPYGGEHVQRPRYLNDEEIIFYGSFYNAERGFYAYDTASSKIRLLHADFSSSDFNYQLTANGRLMYAAFRPDPIYDATFKSDLFSYDLNTGSSTRITHKKRVYAPSVYKNTYIALQTEHSTANLVLINQQGEIERRISVPDTRFFSVIPNPANPEQLAVLANRRGVQALWITTLSQAESDVAGLPDIGFSSASVYDPQWHPSGQKLLFTADLPPAMNIFEYDLTSERIVQITNSRFNAVEASYLPGKNSITYVQQSGDERKLALLKEDYFFNQELDDSVWKPDDSLRNKLSRPLLGDTVDTSKWEIQPYKNNFSWLRPRGVLPVIQESAQDNVFEWGVGIFGADALSSQSYYAELTGIQERLWWQLNYSNKSFYPGFNLKAESSPLFRTIGVLNPENPNQVLRFNRLVQEREFDASVPFQYTFRADTRFSSLRIEPGIEWQQLRFFSLAAEELSGFSNLFNATLSSQLNLNLLQNPRDLQPSSGFVAFSSLEYGLNDDNLLIDIPELNGQVINPLTDTKALFGAFFAYFSPLRKYSQSLRLDFRVLTQSKGLVFDTNSIVPLGFDGDIFTSFDNNTVRFSSRYLIPLVYPDRGNVTLPLYLSSIYVSTFTHTLGTFGHSASFFEDPRTVIGAGLRFRFKLSNLPVDIGVGFAFEPARDRTEVIIGEF